MRLLRYFRRRPPEVTYELRYEWHPVYGRGMVWIPHRREDDPFLRAASGRRGTGNGPCPVREV